MGLCCSHASSTRATHPLRARPTVVVVGVVVGRMIGAVGGAGLIVAAAVRFRWRSQWGCYFGGPVFVGRSIHFGQGRSDDPASLLKRVGGRPYPSGGLPDEFFCTAPRPTPQPFFKNLPINLPRRIGNIH